MGMKALALPFALAAVLAAPAHAAASGALGQARAAASDPVSFDGAAAKPEGTFVPADAPTDDRTAAQVAKDEQARSDARRSAAASPTLGADLDRPASEPNEWLKAAHITSGARGVLVGMIIGSLGGLTGLLIGALLGGLIGYALSRFKAKDA